MLSKTLLLVCQKRNVANNNLIIKLQGSICKQCSSKIKMQQMSTGSEGEENKSVRNINNSSSTEASDVLLNSIIFN